MFQDKSTLLPAGQDLVKRVLAKDFTSVETRDAAITVIGAANAMTDTSPQPFGATPDETIRSDGEAVKAAEQLDGELGAFGADGDEPAEGIGSGLLLSLAAFVARKFLERWLSK